LCVVFFEENFPVFVVGFVVISFELSFLFIPSRKGMHCIIRMLKKKTDVMKKTEFVGF